MSVFGAEFERIWPKRDSVIQFTKFGKSLLNKCINIKKPAPETDIQKFITTSSNFPIEFGTNTCRTVSQRKERYPFIKQQIASAYPVIHERVLSLYLQFLEHKSQYGNKLELEVYVNLSLTEFVQRLLTKRCASFVGKNDHYLLISGHQGYSGFMKVGTDEEKAPLVLQNVLSYDEIKLSALLSVSSHTEFLNDGNRNNSGVIERDKSKIQTDGVVVGIIGARFKCPNVMEFEDIIITEKQNKTENGYGINNEALCNTRNSNYRRIWKDFYEENDFNYADVRVDGKRFTSFKKNRNIFDNLIMKKRYTISFDTLLLESQARAAAVGKQAFIHVVGIGLGVWKVAKQQENIFLETFAQRLKVLLPKLTNIGVVHFAWFHLSEWGELKNDSILNSETHPNGGIKIYLSNRNPADKLSSPEQENMLLIVSYPWDGNALPGNEFWMRCLSSTGDSATACSTLISELHNPHININMVNGNNLHIASEKYGLLHISNYAENVLN